MNTEQGTYFDTLAAALREAGVPAEQIAATVAELRGHLAETDSAPEEEFGPAEEFAARLGGTAPVAAEPADRAETWVWTADIYSDRRLLALHGDQGWEVEGLDTLGRFMCRRVPGAALRWEYRRELISRKRRDEVLDRLTPEGWELCGEWMIFAYFKRPKAASEGPAATLDALPERPGRWLFLSRKGKVLLTVWMLMVIAAVGVTLVGVFDMPAYTTPFVALFGATGALIGLKRDAAKGCQG
ncbi:hypothetical protein AB0D99_15270 [Streptomyces sp. NPDC047971]|uniref:hypothetical protein n=1 Tax=Streptomyces sp. NPDC047971 TaxID=3154499 RepID=UPI0033C8C3C9